MQNERKLIRDERPKLHDIIQMKETADKGDTNPCSPTGMQESRQNLRPKEIDNSGYHFIL